MPTETDPLKPSVKDQERNRMNGSSPTTISLRTRAWWLLAAAVVGVVLLQTVGFAEPEKTKAESNAAKPTAFLMTPEREAAAVTFAQQHHPELEQLIQSLKKSDRRQYRLAIQHLYTQSEKLARIRERSEERYLNALKVWQLDSRIRLMAARLSMTDDPTWEAELKKLLEARHDLRLEQLEAEQIKLLERLSKVERDIAGMTDQKDEMLATELQRLKTKLETTVTGNRAAGATRNEKKSSAAPKRSATSGPRKSKAPATTVK